MSHLIAVPSGTGPVPRPNNFESVCKRLDSLIMTVTLMLFDLV